MSYPIWAQAVVEYGIMAELASKISRLYAHVEYSLQHNQGTWLFAGLALVVGVWLVRRP